MKDPESLIPQDTTQKLCDLCIYMLSSNFVISGDSAMTLPLNEQKFLESKKENVFLW